jgi:hydrogenase nickel incorporation protein HypA/HybF
MHEMGLAQGILDIALEAAAGEKVRQIDLLVGRGQLVNADSLEFSFRLIAQGTPAGDARFTTKEIPVRLRCKSCGEDHETESPPYNCRACGSADVEFLSGDEFLVDAVELENGRIVARAGADGRQWRREHKS